MDRAICDKTAAEMGFPLTVVAAVFGKPTALVEVALLFDVLGG